MPGRFREGTETCIRKVRTLETLPTCRQTQNPERGRKLEIQHHIRSCGMLPKSSDPKPREGTETLMVGHGRARLSGSSDPKPREGTETGRRIAPGAGGAAVVRPKTPRGDGNTETQHQPDNLILASSDPKPREGTETHIARHTTATLLLHVLRPKTPRGDGNAPWMADALCAQVSSDPKPREGTETRGTVPPGPAPSGSSDPKPREGTETSTPSVPHTGPVPCRQTQNPERGRKLNNTFFERGAVESVVRPKTPRGDGNTPPMTAMSE
ncbi:Uncharacterised protein [Mycobacterium tuberculosis]|nr:Uncharacterised protein [Mycobacterium tuberculosis]